MHEFAQGASWTILVPVHLSSSRVVAKEPGEAASASPKLIVQRTVKPLKTAENVVTSERNQNDPKQRGGGKRAMRKPGGHTQKGGN
jgi:hypothetical protein